MGQTPDEIKQQIEDTRENLTANLERLERRVKSVADWRHHFQTHPAAAIVLAVGVGALLSRFLSGRSR